MTIYIIVYTQRGEEEVSIHGAYSTLKAAQAGIKTLAEERWDTSERFARLWSKYSDPSGDLVTEDDAWIIHSEELQS